jgi:hypothetical protein
MSRYYVHLKHPDGTIRVLAQEKIQGILVITTDKPNCHRPPALFTNPKKAHEATTKLLAERKFRLPRFPDYEIIVLEKKT